jgi:hypothetical protein
VQSKYSIFSCSIAKSEIAPEKNVTCEGGTAKTKRLTMGELLSLSDVILQGSVLR